MFKLAIIIFLVMAILPTLTFIFLTLMTGYTLVSCKISKDKRDKNLFVPTKSALYSGEPTLPEIVSEPSKKDEQMEKEEEPLEDDIETQAKNWLAQNADLIVEITQPTYREKKFEIEEEKLDISLPVKDKIVLLLMELYPREIRRCGVTTSGSIVGEINN